MRQYAPIVNQCSVVLQAPELTLLVLPQTSDREPAASLLAQNLATRTSTDTVRDPVLRIVNHQ